MNSMQKPRILACAVATILSPAAWADGVLQFASAVDPVTLSESKRSALNLYMTAHEASEYLAHEPDALLIDIRTRAEVAFVGIAEKADKNIPYMTIDDFWEFDDEKGTYKMVVNSGFESEVADLIDERGLSKDSPIILMCRSGSRSARAADLLARQGYSNVYSIVDGFEGDKAPDGTRSVNGWKNARLGWSYKLRSNQAY